MVAQQWGNITAAQLRAIGFSKGAIQWMVEHGLLHRRHRGVYAFGALSRAPESRWAAALLAAGKGSALSHTSAAGFYGQLPVREVIEVVAPTRRPGDERLRIRTPRRFEAIERRGIRVTTPAQTLLDLAACAWPIERMTHDFAAGGHASLDDLRTFARNRRGEPGATALMKALNLPHTRSEWERSFFRWVKTLDGVPAPIGNDPIDHVTVDCHWPQHNRKSKTVRRVRREDWQPAELARWLRESTDVGGAGRS